MFKSFKNKGKKGEAQMVTNQIPDFQDEVKNKVSGVVGIVVAKYILDGVEYFDVRVDNRIYWATPKANWDVVKKCDE
jgi:hypothetical protein